MLTTSRKIEIATAVMEDPRLGRVKGKFRSICGLIDELFSDDYNELIKHMWLYFTVRYHSNAMVRDFWFTTDGKQARTERIEFLKKYIQHLKQQ